MSISQMLTGQLRFSQDLILSHLPALFEVVGNPDGLSHFLDQVADELNVQALNVFSVDTVEDELTNTYLSSRLLPRLPEYLSLGHYSVDYQIYKHADQLLSSSGFMNEKDYIEQLKKRHIEIPPQADELHEWMKDNMFVYHRAAALLFNSSSHFGFMTTNVQDIPQAQLADFLECFKTIIPFVAKVVETNRPYALLQKRFNAVLEVLDKFRLGVFITNSNADLILSNVAAKELLLDSIGITKNTLGKLDTAQQDKLKSHLRLAGQRLIIGDYSDDKFTLARTNGKSPLYCELMPLNNRDISSDQNTLLLLTIVDPDRNEIVKLDGIESVYELTRSEASVAKHMVDGMSNTEIAESRNVTTETIKSQVKSVFRKTGCSNRIDMVCLAHKTNIPVDSS